MAFASVETTSMALGRPTGNGAVALQEEQGGGVSNIMEVPSSHPMFETGAGDVLTADFLKGMTTTEKALTAVSHGRAAVTGELGNIQKAGIDMYVLPVRGETLSQGDVKARWSASYPMMVVGFGQVRDDCMVKPGSSGRTVSVATYRRAAEEKTAPERVVGHYEDVSLGDSIRVDIGKKGKEKSGGGQGEEPLQFDTRSVYLLRGVIYKQNPYTTDDGNARIYASFYLAQKTPPTPVPGVSLTTMYYLLTSDPARMPPLAPERSAIDACRRSLSESGRKFSEFNVYLTLSPTCLSKYAATGVGAVQSIDWDAPTCELVYTDTLSGKSVQTAHLRLTTDTYSPGQTWTQAEQALQQWKALPAQQRAQQPQPLARSIVDLKLRDSDLKVFGIADLQLWKRSARWLLDHMHAVVVGSLNNEMTASAPANAPQPSQSLVGVADAHFTFGYLSYILWDPKRMVQAAGVPVTADYVAAELGPVAAAARPTAGAGAAGIVEDGALVCLNTLAATNATHFRAMTSSAEAAQYDFVAIPDGQFHSADRSVQTVPHRAALAAYKAKATPEDGVKLLNEEVFQVGPGGALAVSIRRSDTKKPVLLYAVRKTAAGASIRALPEEASVLFRPAVGSPAKPLAGVKRPADMDAAMLQIADAEAEEASSPKRSAAIPAAASTPGTGKPFVPPADDDDDDDNKLDDAASYL